MRLSIAFALGLILLLPSSANADPPYQPKIIPNCGVVKLANGQDACAYTSIEDVKLVYRADAELVMRRQENGLLLKQAEELKLQVASFSKIASGHERINLRLQERLDALTKERLACDEELQKAKVGSPWGSTLAWGVAGAAVAVLAGFVLARSM